MHCRISKCRLGPHAEWGARPSKWRSSPTCNQSELFDKTLPCSSGPLGDYHCLGLHPGWAQVRRGIGWLHLFQCWLIVSFMFDLPFGERLIWDTGHRWIFKLSIRFRQSARETIWPRVCCQGSATRGVYYGRLTYREMQRSLVWIIRSVMLLIEAAFKWSLNSLVSRFAKLACTQKRWFIKITYSHKSHLF